MGTVIEIKVPNIGDFSAVEVIEILVKPGDTVSAEDSLISVESDKASMEIRRRRPASSSSCWWRSVTRSRQAVRS
jgi:hypothetical protein